MPGMVTPATIGWNIVSSSWRPRKYHGAFDGFGVRFTLASASSGALTSVENTSRNAVMNAAATNSTTSRCGQTLTLSVGVALTSWIEPALTTVSRRWVWPAGPVMLGVAGAATAAAAVAAAAGAEPPAVAGAAVPVAGAPPPSAAARRAAL